MAKAKRQQSLPGMEADGEETDAPVVREHSNATRPSANTSAASSTSPSAAAAENPAGKTAFILDAHSLIFQVFHAIPEMTSPSGEAVAAVFGFIRDVLYIIEQKQPDYLFCAFDVSARTFRHEFFPAYKEHRDEMPAELPGQIEKICRVLDALRVPVLGVEGFEADDVLATFARLCDEQDVRCFLVTNDKDCRQLITDRVKLYNVRKDLVYSERELAADWGIRPDQVVDFQALVGDKVDNVPGVPLIGPKIARELLTTYGTLDSVLDHAAEVKGAKRRQNLLEGREAAEQSRRLVELEKHVPVEIDWNAGRVGGFDTAAAAELFRQFGFRTFREQVEGLSGQDESPEAPWEATYTLVDTPQKLADLARELAGQTCISVDTETTHLQPRWAELVGLSFSFEPGVAHYVSVRGPENETCLELAPTLEALRPVLENDAIRKIGQNLKYDRIVLRGQGIELRGIDFDTMIASYLLDAGQRNYNLDELAKRHLNHTMIPIRDLIGIGKQQRCIDEAPLADVAAYAGEDADVPLRLRPLLADRMAEAELDGLFRDVEMPLVEVLAEMEWNGIRVDVDRLKVLSRRFGERLTTLEREIYELAEGEFNIASPKQLADVLFARLHLPVLKKTKSGPSTDADVLAQLAKQHPLPERIVEHRQFAKLKSSYVDALPDMVHPQTGRVHASFNQVVAATGRLSSSDPNLQNIPIRNEAGREIRSAFLPEPGWKLLAADYSQIELRVLAHFSGDEALRAAFERDEDIHARVAAEVFGVAPQEVTSEMRRRAKAVNFGIIYGQSPFGLAAALDIEKSEAATFIDAYFERYPGVEEFLEKTLEWCRKNGYVKTVLGRRRAIRGVRAEAGRQRNLPERTAINTVIQGSAADLIKLAMIHIHRRLRAEHHQARMLLQIHDELVFEVPSTELESLVDLVRQEMAEVLDLSVPLKIDLKSGDNWAACEPWQ